jgi:hypothetical protein
MYALDGIFLDQVPGLELVLLVVSRARQYDYVGISLALSVVGLFSR